MRRKRILVVDDEVAFTRLLKLNLERTSKYDVRVVNWAEDALFAAREFQPDVVLLDIFMPRLVGGDVAGRLRADASLRHTPIVFFTAAISRTRIKEHNGVINGFPLLAKPATVEEIIERIERLALQEQVVAPASSASDCAPEIILGVGEALSPSRRPGVKPISE